MIDWTKPIRRKNGSHARLVGELLNHGRYTRAVEVQWYEGGWGLHVYTEDGKHTPGHCDDDRQLENIPKNIQEKLVFERWVVVNSWGNDIACRFKKDAHRIADASGGKIIHIRQEYEGQ